MTTTSTAVWGVVAFAPSGSTDTVLELVKGAELGPKIAVGSVVGLFLLWLVGLLLYKAGKRSLRILWIIGAVMGLLGAVGFGAWSFKLPEHHGTYFELWHQVVRASAAVSLTVFVLCTMALLLPLALNRVERSSAVGFVAARHIRATKSGFLTVISILSIAGVAVSSLALCAVISIMGGFGTDLKRKILGNNAHISVDYPNVGGFGNWDSAVESVRLIPGVAAATPVAAGEAMASSNSNTGGVIIRGVEPRTVATVIELVDNIEVGSFEYLVEPEKLLDLPADTIIGLGPGGQPYKKGPPLRAVDEDLDPEVAEVLRPNDAYPGLIVGRELAKSLHVLLGDEVRLVAPLGDLGPMGVMPRTKRYRIAGIFYSGMYEYDASQVYMLLDEAQDFLDLRGHITQIDVRVEDEENVTPVRDRVEQALSSELRVRDWKELNKNLFSALKLEKIATFVILCIAITVACFCIVCTLLLMVTEKSKEIAIIKALGASDRMVLHVFMAEGIIIGGVGTAFGVTTGWVLSYALQRVGVKLDPEVYYVDRLPIEVNPVDYGLVAACALVITVLATLYPALSASRVRPVDGIRYE